MQQQRMCLLHVIAVGKGMAWDKDVLIKSAKGSIVALKECIHVIRRDDSCHEDSDTI